MSISSRTISSASWAFFLILCKYARAYKSWKLHLCKCHLWTTEFSSRYTYSLMLWPVTVKEKSHCFRLRILPDISFSFPLKTNTMASHIHTKNYLRYYRVLISIPAVSDYQLRLTCNTRLKHINSIIHVSGSQTTRVGVRPTPKLFPSQLSWISTLDQTKNDLKAPPADIHPKIRANSKHSVAEHTNLFGPSIFQPIAVWKLINPEVISFSFLLNINTLQPQLTPTMI